MIFIRFLLISEYWLYKIKGLEVDAEKMYVDLQLNCSYIEKLSAKRSESAY
jgi:hypothetical protein